MNICNPIDNVKIRINNVDYELYDILPFGCLFLSQTVYPYYLTLKQGGWFPWVRKKEGVLCHCPLPDGLKFAIKRNEINVINKGKCPLTLAETEVIGPWSMYVHVHILAPYIVDCAVNKKNYELEFNGNKYEVGEKWKKR